MDATVFTPNTEPIAIFKNLAAIVLLGVIMYFAYGWIKKGSSGGGRKVKPVAKM
tara:strand:- start:230 stop:391 length:162 start_codon:yes stop_codon:yes gene_type:complete